MERAFHLKVVGYPELAAGDAFKAKTLARARLDVLRDKPTTIGQKVRPYTEQEMEHLLLRSILFLAETLQLLDESSGMQELCNEGLNLSPSNPDLQQLSEVAARILAGKQHQAGRLPRNSDPYVKIVSTGRILNEPYPFLAPKHMTRSEETVHAVQGAFEVVSSNCSLAPRRFSSESSSKAEGFGVYANADVKPGSKVFEDQTILGATDTSSSAPSSFRNSGICDNCCGSLPRSSKQRIKCKHCSALYCSEYCHTAALMFNHQAMCGQNYDWLFKGLRGMDPNRHEMSGPMWLRVLSTCVQSDCHPLDHPLIARLVPHSDTAGNPRAWTLRHNIIRPNKILLQLGVDIFQDLRYDTWVLQNVGIRLTTNQHGRRTKNGRPIRAVSSLYSFLNHSCEPNAEWKCAQVKDGATAHESTTIIVSTTRSIKNGEEICIDYNDVGHIRNKTRRQKSLVPWFPDGACECTRCQRES